MLCFPSPTEILILLKRFYCSCDSSSSASRRNTMSFNIPVHSPDSFTSGHLEQSCGDGFMTMIGNTLLRKSGSLETHQCALHTFLLSHQTTNHSQFNRSECGHQMTILYNLSLNIPNFALWGDTALEEIPGILLTCCK